jgi:tape measure domain-containing protein
MATEYSVSVLLRLVDRLSNPLNKISRKMINFSEKLKGIGEKMQEAGKKLSLLVTTPLVLMGKKAIQTAASFEKNRIALEAMLGSAEKAKVLLQDLVEFAATTPFQLPGLIEGSKQLLAFGIPAEDIITKLRNLGNIAQGDQGKLTGLVQAFGKIRAKGVASMRELNMMINSGVPIMRALSEEMGVTEAQIFEMSRTGQLTFERIDRAITNLTTGTGMFAGILEKQSKSLAGLWSTLMDNLSLLGKEIAETFMPLLKSLINGVMGIVKWFRSLSDSTKNLIGIVLALVAAMGPLTFLVGKLFVLFATGMGPVGLVIAALTALMGIIVGITIAIDKYNNRFKDAANRAKENRKETKKLVDEYEALEKNTNRTREEQDRFLSLQRQLKVTLGDTAFEINKVTGELELNRKEFEKWNEEMRILEIKNLQKELGRLTNKLTEQTKETDRIRKLQENYNKEFNLMFRMEDYDEMRLNSLKMENSIKDQITTIEQQIGEYLKLMVVGEDTMDTIDEGTENVNKNLKTMAELLDEIDQKMKQRLVRELLKGKESRFFRTVDVIKKFEKTQRDAAKAKVDVSIKVEAEEGTSAKISKIEKTGEEADVTLATSSYIGYHQFTM